MLAQNQQTMYGGSGCSTPLAGQDLGGQSGGQAADNTKVKPVVIDGKKYKMRYGSRRQVYNGTAYMTKGNLKQKDIVKNKQDRFVSLKKSLMAKKEQRLLKHGYGAVKGKFGYVRVDKNGNPIKKTAKSATKKPKSATKKPKSAAPAPAPVEAPMSVAPASDLEPEPNYAAAAAGGAPLRRRKSPKKSRKTKGRKTKGRKTRARKTRARKTRARKTRGRRA
jgi:hypothetical protein